MHRICVAYPAGETHTCGSANAALSSTMGFAHHIAFQSCLPTNEVIVAHYIAFLSGLLIDGAVALTVFPAQWPRVHVDKSLGDGFPSSEARVPCEQVIG